MSSSQHAEPVALQSLIGGAWKRGGGDAAKLVDPVTDEGVATASTSGLDLAAALGYARETGGPALRAMNFAERAAKLGEVVACLNDRKAQYHDIARRNSGNTKADAQIDVEGGIGTLQYIARMGAGLGTAKSLVDGGIIRLAKTTEFQGLHLYTPRHGVALHINAFNFPSWGLWEKAGIALLCGVPVITKPATATAWLTEAMVRDVDAAGILPKGALSVVVGGAGNLLDGLTGGDVVAFTGSASTAAMIRGHKRILENGVGVNIEADSLNAAVLLPGASADSAVTRAFVREAVREMTIKAGQKCTAIRRIFVPRGLADAVADALVAALSAVKVGNPANADVQMGPLVSRGQRDDALKGIAALSAEADVLTGGKAPATLVDADPARGAFLAPTLLRVRDTAGAKKVHDIEVFGPVATLIPYDGMEELARLVAAGGGSLTASVYGDDAAVAQAAALALAPFHGRIMFVSEAVADQHTGHGIVLPMLNHGGPGRAGGGEELGGMHALRFYHQRTAIQGPTALLEALTAASAKFA